MGDSHFMIALSSGCNLRPSHVRGLPDPGNRRYNKPRARLRSISKCCFFIVLPTCLSRISEAAVLSSRTSEAVQQTSVFVLIAKLYCTEQNCVSSTLSHLLTCVSVVLHPFDGKQWPSSLRKIRADLMARAQAAAALQRRQCSRHSRRKTKLHPRQRLC